MSFPRRRETRRKNRELCNPWIPVFTGMTRAENKLRFQTDIDCNPEMCIISQWGWRWQATGQLYQIELKASKHKTNPMKDMWKTIFWTALDEFPDSDSYGLAQKYSSVSPLTEKETRCLGILFEKYPALGILANRLCQVIFVRSLCCCIMLFPYEQYLPKLFRYWKNIDKQVGIA